MTIKGKIQKIEDSVLRLETGRYVDVDINWITTQIDWLYRFHHIDYEQMSSLVDRVTMLFEEGRV